MDKNKKFYDTYNASASMPATGAQGTNYQGKQLIKGVTYSVVFDHPAASMELDTTIANAGWSIDSSTTDSTGNTIYKLIYNKDDLPEYYLYTSQITLPFQFVVPPEANATNDTGIAVGDALDLDCTLAYHYYGSDWTMEYKFYLQFTILPSGAAVWINNATNSTNAVTKASDWLKASTSGSPLPEKGNLYGDWYMQVTQNAAQPLNTEGMVHRVMVGNAGGSSATKKIKIYFNLQTDYDGSVVNPSEPRKANYHSHEVVGITALQLPFHNPDIGKTATFTYKLTDGTSGTATVPYDIFLSIDSLTNKPDVYFAELEYDVEIPGGYEGFINHFMGVKLKEDELYSYTIEIVDQDNPDKKIQSTSWMTTDLRHYNRLRFILPEGKTVPAGSDLPMSVELTASAGNDSSVLSEGTVVYLVSESGSAFKDFSITTQLGGTYTTQNGLEVSAPVTTDSGAKVYTLKLPLKSRKEQIGSISTFIEGVHEPLLWPRNTWTVNWTIETSGTSKDVTYPYTSMVYVHLPYYYAGNRYTDDLVYSKDTTSFPIHIADITTNSGVLHPKTDAGYTIVGNSMLAAALYVEEDGKYSTTAEYDPAGVGEKIADKENALNARLSLQNNSDKTMNQVSVVYLPIPKKGQNWGPLSNNAAFAFSLELDGEVSVPDGNKVEYGFIDPKSSYDALKNETFYTTIPTGKTLADVNCLKITTDLMASGQLNNYDLTLYLADPPQDVTAKNAWQAAYSWNLSGTIGSGQGAMIYAQAGTAELTGYLFEDKNLNGVKDAGETLPVDYTNWVLKLVAEDAQGSEVETDRISFEEAHGEFDSSSGQYHFYRLVGMAGKYTLVVEKPLSNNVNWMFAPEAETTATQVGNAMPDPGASQPAGRLAVTPVETLTDTQGVYHVGVIQQESATVQVTLSSPDVNKLWFPDDTGAPQASLTLTGLYNELIPFPTLGNGVAVAEGFAFNDIWLDGNTRVDPQNTPFGTAEKTYIAQIDSAGAYTVNYDLGEGHAPQGASADAFSSKSVLWTDTFSTHFKPNVEPVKDGASFAHWYYLDGTNQIELTDTTTYATIAGNVSMQNVTLYAAYTDYQYTVSYLNADDTSYISQTYTWGDPFAFPASSPTVSGKHFLGWFIGEAANPVVSNATLADLGLTADGTVLSVTLKARFDSNTYTLKFYQTNPPQDDNYVQKEIIGLDQPISLPTGNESPEQPGKTLRWVVEGNAGDDDDIIVDPDDTIADLIDKGAPLDENDNSELELVPKYTDKNYTIRYDLNDSGESISNPPSPQTVTWNQLINPYTYTGEPQRPNYSFTGWAVTISDSETLMLTNENTSLSALSQNSALPSLNDSVTEITLKAQWVKTEYSVVFNLNGGKLLGQTGSYTKYVQWEDSNLSPGNPVKADYHFVGWVYGTDETPLTDATTYAVLANGQPSTKSVQVYAVWKESAVVNLGGDDGTGVEEPNGPGTGPGSGDAPDSGDDDGTGDGPGGGTVGDNGKGDPGTGSYDEQNAAFSVVKMLTGYNPNGTANETFAFTIAPSNPDTHPMPVNDTVYISTSSGTNDATHVYGLKTTSPKYIGFGSLKFTNPGTYTYTITETQGSRPQYIYNTNGISYTLTVTVEDEDGAGNLKLQSVSCLDSNNYPAKNFIFTNRYKPTSVMAPELPDIVVDGGSENPTITFEVVLKNPDPSGLDPDNMPLPPNNPQVIVGKGVVDFDPWEYTEPGEYVYEIEADDHGSSVVDFPSPVFTVKDTVKDKDGQLVVERVIIAHDEDGNGGSINGSVSGGTGWLEFTIIGPGPKKPPKTGDDSHLLLWSLLLLTSAAAAVVITRRRRNA